MNKKGVVNLKDLIVKTIKIYNKYRSPEITAKLAKIEENRFIIHFEGSFCKSCGVRDYFEDFIYEWKDANKNTNLEIMTTEPSGKKSFKVLYDIKNNHFQTEEGKLFQDFLKKQGLTRKEFLNSNSCTKDVIKFHFQTWLYERNKTE